MKWTCSANVEDMKMRTWMVGDTVGSYHLSVMQRIKPWHERDDHLGDLHTDGRIILKWTIKNYAVKV